MALQLNINTRTAEGGIEIPNPIIARFIPIPMWETKSQRFEFKYAVLENEGGYGKLGNVLYEKLIQMPIWSIPENEEDTPEIIGTIDVIQKNILPKALTKQISGLPQIYALYAQIEQIMPQQSAFVKNVFGYHLMAQELLAPIVGIENIVIRLDLA
jgi:hypothetical protein